MGMEEERDMSVDVPDVPEGWPLPVPEDVEEPVSPDQQQQPSQAAVTTENTESD